MNFPFPTDSVSRVGKITPARPAKSGSPLMRLPEFKATSQTKPEVAVSSKHVVHATINIAASRIRIRRVVARLECGVRVDIWGDAVEEVAHAERELPILDSAP